jgi:cell division protein FtsN
MSGAAGKGKVIAGVFIGMVLGIVAAGTVAWYIMEKRQNTFNNKEKEHKVAPVVAPLVASAPVAAAPASATPAVIPAASGVAEPKQHFEFYKVLTDKQDNTPRKNTVKPKEPAVAKETAVVKHQPTPPVAVAVTKEMYFVQAGAFQNVGDAEKLKAKLAFSGFEASIQTANIPDKGVWYRVRLGPYNNGEAGKTVVSLKQNGIVATQVQAQ